jgi:hypothetical protein
MGFERIYPPGTIPDTPMADFHLDKEYILAAMGLLREVAPQVALRMMKKYVVKL